jgi:hypothetical protein
MNKKEGLNVLDFLATGINKEDPIIKAVISDSNGEGALANELNQLFEFINYYTRNDDVKNHHGRSLEMITQIFTKMRRRVNESDPILLRRLFALTHRKGDTIWGNTLNLKHIFETYFDGINCFIAENTNRENILPNGDFENNDFWQLGGGASYEYKARFSGLRGLLFNGEDGEFCAQTVERLFDAGNYTLHFMLKGQCGVIIQREDGKYCNANSQEFSGDKVLTWEDDEIINIFDSPDGWDNAYCFIVLPEDSHVLKIAFISIEEKTAFIDHARLFQKPLNPSYTLIMQYMGYAVTAKTLHLGESADEPTPGVNYKHEAYLESAFIVGPVGVSQSQSFESVLDKVKPLGIQAFAEFVERKEQEDY